MKKTVQINFFLFFLFLLNSINALSQNFYAGIEIGFRGIKVDIIDVRDASKKIWVSEKTWTDYNVIDSKVLNNGTLSNSYIENTSNKILENLNLLLNENNINKNKILIVISSGISVAKNSDIFSNRIFELTQIKPSITTTSIESEHIFDEYIPTKLQKDSFLINIASQNTKGGFYEKLNGELKFVDFLFNKGILSYTEKIGNNLYINPNDFILEISNKDKDLNQEIKNNLNLQELTSSKKNIVLVGGAVWSFFTLFYQDNSFKPMYEIKFDDVLKYDDILKNNFFDYVDYAKKDSESSKVLKFFTQKNLIAANAILINILKNINDLNSKKLYFVKLQEVPWLSTYIIENLNKK